MKFSKYIRQGPKRTAPAPRPIPGAVLQGSSWHVYEADGNKILSYLTGENPEREDEIVLTDPEYGRLATAGLDGEKVVTDIANDRYNKKHGLI